MDIASKYEPVVARIKAAFPDIHFNSRVSDYGFAYALGARVDIKRIAWVLERTVIEGGKEVFDEDGGFSHIEGGTPKVIGLPEYADPEDGIRSLVAAISEWSGLSPVDHMRAVRALCR